MKLHSISYNPNVTNRYCNQAFRNNSEVQRKILHEINSAELPAVTSVIARSGEFVKKSLKDGAESIIETIADICKERKFSTKNADAVVRLLKEKPNENYAEFLSNEECDENLLMSIITSDNSEKRIALDLFREKDVLKELIPKILEKSSLFNFELIRNLALNKKLNFKFKEDIPKILENIEPSSELYLYHAIESGKYYEKRWLRDMPVICWRWICENDIGLESISKIPKKYFNCLRFYSETTNPNIINEHLRFVRKSVEKPNIISDRISNKIENSKEDIEMHMFSRRVIKSLDILGVGNLIAALDELKLDKFNEFCSDISNMRFSKEAYELLESKINPVNTNRYREMKKELVLLKKSLNTTENKKDLIKKINEKDYEIRKFLSQKIDLSPQEIISRLWIISSVSDGHADINLIKSINSSTPKNDLLWKKAIDKKIYEKMNVPYDEKLSEKLDLANCQYINKLFLSDERFFNNLKSLVLIIAKNPNKTVEEALDNLIQNKITKRMFDKNGINYEKWTKVDKNSILRIKDFEFKKVNMYDIKYALATGNHAGCCNALGKHNKEWTTPNYIKNKCFSSIEVLDNGKPIGNTIIYMAQVDGKLSLIIDNIELRKEYHQNDDILNGIIKYAKRICEEIGCPEAKIYAGPNRHKTNMLGFNKAPHNLSILGNTGNDTVYLDFDIFNDHQLGFRDYKNIELYEIK